MLYLILVILFSMFLALIRVLNGKTTYDRLLAANLFGTKTVILIVLLSILLEEPMLLDIALIYVLMNFITTIGFLKFFKYRSLDT